MTARIHNSNPIRRHLLTVSLPAALVLTAGLAAGPLNPPAGPVAPAYKTLSEVEPRTAVNATNTPGAANAVYVISQPGSYYLSGNVIGEFGKHGVRIDASGVTLDLNGFDVQGVPGSLDGVVAVSASMNNNVIVKNGSVRNWGGNGVNVFNAASNTIVSDIVASGNGGNGIMGGFGGIVSRCASNANVGNGISVGTATTVTECSVYTNQGSGITTGAGCTITNCTARQNTLDGIVAFRQCIVTYNTCHNNGLNAGVGAGIKVTDVHNRIEHNTCSQADRGIHVTGNRNIIISNSCGGNTTANFDIAANNFNGPVIDRRIPEALSSTPAVVGNSSATSIGTLDPYANFAY